MGRIENKSYEQLLGEFPQLVTGMLADWSAVPPPGGESFEDVWRAHPRRAGGAARAR